MTRVRAPELRGRGWLNTGGRELKLADFRGRILILDFWTFCCINCLHVLDELRPLEEKYADVLVIVGVHSPKFEHERDPLALAAAVQRYGVEHPVLDDPQLQTWSQYAAKAWPTLTVVDPEGYVVASMAGEGHAEGLTRLVEELVMLHSERGTLHRGDGPYVAPPQPPTTLRFPGKAILSPTGTLLVADSAHHRIVELGVDDDATVLRAFGDGERGHVDGPTAHARFREPGGLCLLPPSVAELAGYDLVVADTVNHLLRSINLSTGEVGTVAGTGRAWRSTVDFHAHDAIAADLSSPWDLAWFDDRVIVAMAGIHQLWWFDPVKRTVGVYAGTTVEALRDGPLEGVFMAQPSGLSVSADGTTLWIADAETSALRRVRDGEMVTVVGRSLYDFGHVDGPAGDALLQHPLGVCTLPDGSVLVADTYNGAVRRYDDATDTVSTVATDLAEPSDLVLLPDGDVLVVESAAHRVTRLAEAAVTAAGLNPATTATDAPTGVRHRSERPPTLLAPGRVALEVVFTPAPGQKLDQTFGPATRLEVSASPPSLLVEGAGVGTEFGRTLVLAADVDGGVLAVVAQVATCDAEAEHAACHLTRQDWGVPIRVDAGGDDRLPLVLHSRDLG
ncbi:MAG: NHL domain-containing thioredoxin family protein [Micromonosporaceae bacterium]